ncbi:hypothetical protein GCM10010910_11810 [Microbacterium nanhaiense]|uniref:Uncharacterized protein n=1 Tax=Microbacterium nanhaiense TaxID=1301026 RepID=A0ABQ2MYT8_9MICO|nr:hypothetical protein [Microbacterium nanhaiense]GGO62224.1 hypothetical protein GCM10010910_11810 [Microbacterium nanhaiense]
MTEEPRQRVEKVRGSRRARLTRVEGTLSDSEAEATLREQEQEARPPGPAGANDARLLGDKPPHY